MYVPNGKHSRHYRVEEQNGYRKVRSAKHRYVYFCTSDKKLKRQWMQCLNYPIMPYPKGDNSNYILGNYIKDVIVEDKKRGDDIHV